MTLCERRKAKQMKQEDVATILDVDRSTVSKWETGELPSTPNLINLAKFYNCTIDELLVKEKTEAN